LIINESLTVLYINENFRLKVEMDISLILVVMAELIAIKRLSGKAGIEYCIVIKTIKSILEI
jgi:hypothetical protein